MTNLLKQNWNDQLLEELETLRASNLYRTIRNLEPVSSTEALCSGKKLTLFCSNDYLGLAHHPEILKAAEKAARESGTGSGAARLISGTSAWHLKLEEKISQIKKKERTLLFTAGYLANVGALSALAGEEDLIVMDKLCHASLIDGARLSQAEVRVYPHKNYERLCEILETEKEYRRRILVSDSVFSMDGDIANIKELVRIKRKYDCLLVIDDAHGLGVFGKKGSGAVEESEVDVVTGTLSKAAGSIGGFVSSSKTVIEFLTNKSRSFIFATALPPYVCAASLKALEIIEEDPLLREKLWSNLKVLREGISRINPELKAESPILPYIVGDEKKALEFSQGLYERGYVVPAVRTPSVPKGKARLRITVSAAHEKAQISGFLKALTDLQKNFSGS